MPDLPTLTLSQEHFDRVVASFPGTTAPEKIAAYQAWLANRLIDYVEQVERDRIHTEYTEDLEAALLALHASLPDRPLFPPPTQ